LPKDAFDYLTLLLELLKLLAQKGDVYTPTAKIQEELCRLGVLSKEPDGRKRLLRVLNKLKELGYVETLHESVRGRKSQEWKINLRSLPYLNALSEEELISLFILTSFVPKKYRSLPVLRPGLSIVERLGKLLDVSKREIAKDSFDYLPLPVERYTKVKKEDFELIFKAIVERRQLIVNYMGQTKTICPLKVFHYNGIFYLSCYLPENGQYRSFQVVRLQVNGLGKRCEKAFLYRKLYGNLYFGFSEEPFILKVELPIDYVHCHKPDHGLLIYPTQFHLEKKSSTVWVWVVGQASYRYASWIILDEVVNFHPPTQEDLNLARQRRLKELHPELSYGLKENLKRYEKFREFLKLFFEKRKGLLKG
jgi:hypothetical protein